MKPIAILISSRYQDIRVVDETLRSMLTTANFPESIIGACELSIHELLTNLVDHAYKGNPNGQITVHLEINPSGIIMETRDFGKPADLDLSNVSMPDPFELAEGGYGLAIIKSQVDDLQYRTENGQNIWQLTKYIN